MSPILQSKDTDAQRRRPAGTGASITRAWGVLAGLMASLAVSMAAAAGIGSTHIGVATVIRAILHGPAASDNPAFQIVWSLRLPEITLAALVGGALAAAGVAFQSLLRNDLADPYVVGVSSGASVGAEAILLAHGDGWIGGAAPSTAAMAGAVAAMTIVYTMARRRGRILVTNLLLGGVIVGAFLASVSTLMLVLGNPYDYMHVMARLMGSLQEATFPQCGIVGAALLVGVVILASQAQAMNAFSLGEETAAQLGVDVERFKRILIVTGSLLTAVAVAVGGIIGFVGLVVPHAARRLAGTPNHRSVIPIATVAGGLLMVWADTIARSIAPGGAVLPVGVITAFVGAPFFVYLLRKKTGSGP